MNELLRHEFDRMWRNRNESMWRAGTMLHNVKLPNAPISPAVTTENAWPTIYLLSSQNHMDIAWRNMRRGKFCQSRIVAKSKEKSLIRACVGRSVGRCVSIANHTHTHLHLCVGIVSCSFRAKVLHCDAWMISHSEYGRLLRRSSSCDSQSLPTIIMCVCYFKLFLCVYVCMSYRHTYMERSLATRTNKRKQL